MGSYMKRKAYIFMYVVGVIGFFITIIELLYQIQRNLTKFAVRQDAIRHDADFQQKISRERMPNRSLWDSCMKQCFGIDRKPRMRSSSIVDYKAGIPRSSTSSPPVV